jgi:hypothetical protein
MSYQTLRRHCSWSQLNDYPAVFVRHRFEGVEDVLIALADKCALAAQR